ncbi:transposase [Rhodococcus sp. D-46]|uniref:transposase n=1 Tax=Rhodococcus TaxID=1827 RepID=UPI0013F5FA76|nr:transposase [Rhodococcus sp. (in: high G+C Gram-positive bacteria)]NHE67528.1 transposase [Rhodococcus sp. D-46]QXC46558.1 transposase [Rhodococcus qingshengii]
MPRPYPPELRFRATTLVRAGKPIIIAAYELGVSAAALHTWVRQGRGERPSHQNRICAADIRE